MSTITHARRFEPARWRSIDIISVVVLGVAFGVIFWGWAQISEGPLKAAMVALGPAQGLFGGPWLLAGVVGGLLVRRPGAAIATELLAATVEALMGNAWGATTLISGLLQGAGVEIILLLFLFRRFTPAVAMLCGAAAVVTEMLYEWNGYWADMSTSWRVQYGLTFMISGAIVSGLGGWAIMRGLAATGAVDGLAAGREQAERSAI